MNGFAKKRKRKSLQTNQKGSSIGALFVKKRYNVNKHLMAIHKLNAPQARGLRRQLDLYKKPAILPAEKRKTKRTRTYERLACPVKNCHKVIYYLIFLDLSMEVSLSTYRQSSMEDC